MATKDPVRPPAPDLHVGKRKHLGDADDPVPKKRRAAGPQAETHRSAPASSPYSRVYNPLLSRLSGKFEVKAMSVMPSTSISKHVDRALEHLGRFSAWDQTVLPGVVLLCAKSTASSKLITISELIRRRIGESDQKWYQYNVLSETTVLEGAAQAPGEPSVVEDTFVPVDRESEEGAVAASAAAAGDDDDDDDDEYFETAQPTIHEQAVRPAKVRYKAHMTVLLSRVPLDELKTEQNVSLQTNEQQVEYLRKRKMGLVG